PGRAVAVDVDPQLLAEVRGVEPEITGGARHRLGAQILLAHAVTAEAALAALLLPPLLRLAGRRLLHSGDADRGAAAPCDGRNEREGARHGGGENEAADPHASVLVGGRVSTPGTLGAQVGKCQKPGYFRGASPCADGSGPTLQVFDGGINSRSDWNVDELDVRLPGDLEDPLVPVELAVADPDDPGVGRRLETVPARARGHIQRGSVDHHA